MGGIASVQFGSALADKLFDSAGPAGVVLMRLAFGALVMLVVVRPSWRANSRDHWVSAAIFGLLLASMNWSFYLALERLPLGAAVTIEFIGPLTVAIVGSRRLMDLLWVGLAAGGVVLLGLGHSGDGTTAGLDSVGVLFALLAGAFWAGYIVMSKRVGARFSGLDGLATALAISAVLLIPAGVIQGGHALLEPRILAGGLAVAMLSSVIPYSLELTALRRLSTAAFGLLMSLEPAVAALAGVLVLHQALHVRTVIAIAMVVAASAGSTVGASRNRQRA
jgi:inner membrane transporter RhtA